MTTTNHTTKPIRADNFKHWENDTKSTLVVCIGSDASPKSAINFLEEEKCLSECKKLCNSDNSNDSPYYVYKNLKENVFIDQDDPSFRPPVSLSNADLLSGKRIFLNMEQSNVRFILVGSFTEDCKKILIDQLLAHRIRSAVIDKIKYASDDKFSDERALNSSSKTIEDLTETLQIHYKEFYGEAWTLQSDDALLPKRADENSEILPTDQIFDWDDYPFPSYNKDGDVTGGIVHTENLKYLLGKYGINVRYNVISKRGEAQYPNERTILLDNKEGQILEEIASLSALNRFPTNRLVNQISAIANDSPYNPILEFMTSRPWDGIDRLQELLETVVVDDELNEWKSVAIKKFMMAAACAAINDEYKRWKFKCVLVFQGAQGVGKSPWIRLLVGKAMNPYFLEGHILDPSSRDSCMSALETWITELGELDATVKKSDIAHQKAFLDAGKDKHRLPFAIRHSEMIRRTVFFGTVNPSQFLTDNTGNDRYWCLPVLDLDLDKLESMDTQQIWAQIYEHSIEKLGTGISRPWELTDDEKSLMEGINEAARVLSSTEERLMDAFELVKGQPVKLYATITNIMDALDLSSNNTKDKIVAESYMERTFGTKKAYKGKRNCYAIPIPIGFEHKLEYLVTALNMKTR